MCLPFYILHLANLHTLFVQFSESSADESVGHKSVRGRGFGQGKGRGKGRGKGQGRGQRRDATVSRGRGGSQRGRGRRQLVEEEQAGENADNHQQQLVVRIINVSQCFSICI